MSIRRAIRAAYDYGAPAPLRPLGVEAPSSISSVARWTSIPRWQRAYSENTSTAGSDADGMSLTDSAVRRLKEIIHEEQQPVLLRLAVDGGGCSGFMYSFELARDQNPDDRLFERDGVKVVVDEVSYSFVRGAKVDFSEDLIRSAFQVVDNPNSSTSCGCGASFSAK